MPKLRKPPPAAPGRDQRDIRSIFLPALRPRPLTPDPDDDASPPTRAQSPSSSPFFRLPYEIRRQIFHEAFGGRILHMDLRFEPPREKEAPSGDPEEEMPHCGYVPRDVYADVIESDKRWIWHGSVCHRYEEERIRGEGKYGLSPELDHCMAIGYTKCGLWKGEMPGKCFIGAMGWLLSCRQAYTEVVDILYSQNIIHILNNAALVLNLPRLIPPRRLSCIRYLGLAHRIGSYGDEDPDAALREFDSILTTISTSLPGLRRLVLSLNGSMYPGESPEPAPVPWEDALQAWDAEVFPRVGRLVVSLPALEECVVDVPFRMFDPHEAAAPGRRHQRRFNKGSDFGTGFFYPASAAGAAGDVRERKTLADFRDGFWVVHGTAGARYMAMKYWDDLPYWRERVPVAEGKLKFIVGDVVHDANAAGDGPVVVNHEAG